MELTILDTTLRDGEQREGISYTVKDKLRITQLLDELGVHYIEGGWPGANPKAVEYFEAVKNVKLKNARMAAFGSTRRAGCKVQDDKTMQGILKAGTPVAVIFGKTWDFHVKEALKITLKENLKIIADSVSFLKKNGKEVIFDAEHFFDGYKANKKFAIEALKAADEAGAEILCLCDTNGGTLPSEVSDIVREVRKVFKKAKIGIHPHNDCGLAVANGLAGVEAGACHVQGTLNGYGERCGNMDLMTLLPILVLKKKIKCISEKQLKQITSISHHISEIANLAPNTFAPFVGQSAFTHKAGVHVNAILKNPETYEHIDPRKVGNKQRVLVSEMAGASNLVYKAKQYGIEIGEKDKEALQTLVNEMKELEHFGYQFEEAEASFEMLMLRTLKKVKPIIQLDRFRVLDELTSTKSVDVEATIKAKIGGKKVHIVAEGNGPVSALDHALRKALEPLYPQIKEIKLTDYKVRVLNSKEGTESVVRVLIQWTEGDQEWATVGVSHNIIEASWLALVDSYEYKLK